MSGTKLEASGRPTPLTLPLPRAEEGGGPARAIIDDPAFGGRPLVRSAAAAAGRRLPHGEGKAGAESEGFVLWIARARRSLSS